MREPFRYKPRYGNDINPERCVASVSEPGRGFYSHQCKHKRKPGSEWCGVHEPKVATEDADVLWAVEVRYKDPEPKLVSAKIVKETKKQIVLESGSGRGFDHKTRVSKSEVGYPEIGARTRFKAAEVYHTQKVKEMLNLRERLAEAEAAVERAEKLMEEEREG